MRITLVDNSFQTGKTGVFHNTPDRNNSVISSALRKHDHLLLNTVMRTFNLCLFSINENLTWIMRIQTKNRSHSLCSSSSDQSGKTNNLTFRNMEIYIFKEIFLRKILYLKSFVSNRNCFFRIYIIQFSSNHSGNDRIKIKIFRSVCWNYSTIS